MARGRCFRYSSEQVWIVWGGSEVLVVEPIVFVDDITIKVDEDGVAFSLRSRDFKGGQCVIQDVNAIDFYNQAAMEDEDENDLSESNRVANG